MPLVNLIFSLVNANIHIKLTLLKKKVNLYSKKLYHNHCMPKILRLLFYLQWSNFYHYPALKVYTLQCIVLKKSKGVTMGHFFLNDKFILMIENQIYESMKTYLL